MGHQKQVKRTDDFYSRLQTFYIFHKKRIYKHFKFFPDVYYIYDSIPRLSSAIIVSVNNSHRSAGSYLSLVSNSGVTSNFGPPPARKSFGPPPEEPLSEHNRRPITHIWMIWTIQKQCITVRIHNDMLFCIGVGL